MGWNSHSQSSVAATLGTAQAAISDRVTAVRSLGPRARIISAVSMPITSVPTTSAAQKPTVRTRTGTSWSSFHTAR
ncbi:hypothetical protein [Streptacidiphilus sp. PAMC 29251]